jgi:ATP-dependent exoDNAse (exonuclease V) beta subunit
VQTVKQRFAYGDITVLARDNRDVELHTGWLLEADIPVESEKTLNVRENALVKELVSLITFLNSPIDDLSFASFISGNILEQNAGFADGEIRRFLFNTHRARTGGYLYRAFREAYPELWDRYFEEFFVNEGFVPLYELAVSIYAKFSLMERFPGHQAFFMRFLELIKKHEEENTSIASFLEYFKQAQSNDLYVTVTDTDSVRLLTIHKSKGLEFPVVIIPFLEMDLGMGKKGTAQFDIQRGKDGLSLVRLNKAYGRYSDELAKLYLQKYKKAFIDELNAVYVALTRAKCELYAWVPQKTSSGTNPVRFMIPEPVERGAVRQYDKSGARSKRQLLDIPVAEYRDWLEFVRYEFSGDVGLANRENRLRGEMLHFGLACIGNLARQPIAESIKAAVEKTVAAYPRQADPAGVERTLRKVVEHPALIPFFNVTDGEAFCEKEVADAAGNVKRLDRLVVGTGTVRILDYKSAADDGNAYRKQVLEYMQILKAIYPDKKVTGHLFYFDSLRLEEVIDETELF